MNQTIQTIPIVQKDKVSNGFKRFFLIELDVLPMEMIFTCIATGNATFPNHKTEKNRIVNVLQLSNCYKKKKGKKKEKKPLVSKILTDYRKYI